MRFHVGKLITAVGLRIKTLDLLLKYVPTILQHYRANIVWHNRYTILCITTLYIIITPRMRARGKAIVTDDFSYRSSVTNMLIQLKWPLLEQ